MCCYSVTVALCHNDYHLHFIEFTIVNKKCHLVATFKEKQCNSTLMIKFYLLNQRHLCDKLSTMNFLWKCRGALCKTQFKSQIRISILSNGRSARYLYFLEYQECQNYSNELRHNLKRNFSFLFALYFFSLGFRLHHRVQLPHPSKECHKSIIARDTGKKRN